jgi:hypothetical protein
MAWRIRVHAIKRELSDMHANGSINISTVQFGSKVILVSK